jgi:hypothetical protein
MHLKVAVPAHTVACTLVTVLQAVPNHLALAVPTPIPHRWPYPQTCRVQRT